MPAVSVVTTMSRNVMPAVSVVTTMSRNVMPAVSVVTTMPVDTLLQKWQKLELQISVTVQLLSVQ